LDRGLDRAGEGDHRGEGFDVAGGDPAGVGAALATRSTRGNVWWIWYFRLVLCSSAGRFKADGQRITAPELSNMNNDDALIFRATGLFRQSAEVIWIAR